jgi:exopolyphosphatase/guanosine-5'-triphosphate,3'-diphosphate pyrophosphatase
MNLAVLDLGSNSFHLAVFTSSDRALLAPRRELRSPIQLGASLRDGSIDGAGFARGLLAIESLLRELSSLHPGCQVVAVATSAIRDAVNGHSFCEEIERRHAIKVEILSGRDEARMAFLGARPQPRRAPREGLGR